LILLLQGCLLLNHHPRLLHRLLLLRHARRLANACLHASTSLRLHGIVGWLLHLRLLQEGLLQLC
jgi:hypothetical protein